MYKKCISKDQDERYEWFVVHPVIKSTEHWGTCKTCARINIKTILSTVWEGNSDIQHCILHFANGLERQLSFWAP